MCGWSDQGSAVRHFVFTVLMDRLTDVVMQEPPLTMFGGSIVT